MSAQEPSLRSRAQGALVGLAVGDAAGFPSLFHRTARLGRRRSALWRFATQLDQQHVLRFLMPMSHGLPDVLSVSATDDGEFAAVAALILLEADSDYSSEALFARAAAAARSRSPCDRGDSSSTAAVPATDASHQPASRDGMSPIVPGEATGST